MPISLNLGTISIQDKEVANFIQNKSIDEIKSMIVDFLSHQVKVISNKPVPKKGKWAKVANEMHGTMSHNTVEYLRECGKEVRSGFELRELLLISVK